MDNFIAYWSDLRDRGLAKGRKESWNMTFLNWMKRAWQGKTGREWEQHRHYQFRAPSDGNPFEQVIKNLEPKKEKKEEIATPRDYVLPCPPKREGPTMTAEEAFEQLRKIL